MELIKNMVMMSKNNGQYRNIRALTGNTAFSNVVSQEFILATGRINIMTVINSAVMSFRNFYLVD